MEQYYSEQLLSEKHFFWPKTSHYEETGITMMPDNYIQLFILFRQVTILFSHIILLLGCSRNSMLFKTPKDSSLCSQMLTLGCYPAPA
jgi:hypothetical protein